MRKQYYKKLIERRVKSVWHGNAVLRDLELKKLTLRQLQSVSFLLMQIEVLKSNGGTE